jgi:hypothetical protein
MIPRRIRSVPGRLALLLGLAVFAAGPGRAAAPAFDPDAGAHWAVAPEFSARPARAVPVAGSACEVANAYVTLVDSGRAPEVARLFAPDAIFLGPDDRVLNGREAIAGFYAKVPSLVSHAVPLSFMDRGHECIMELAVQAGDSPDRYRLLAIDHFTVDAQGLVKQLVIYFRPAALRSYQPR